MKKIVFAIQIFGLIAVLPLWVSLEMNHGTETSAVTNTKECTIENAETLSVEFDNSVAKFPIASLAFNQLISKAKQKYSYKVCTCPNCKCANNCTCNDN